MCRRRRRRRIFYGFRASLHLLERNEQIENSVNSAILIESRSNLIKKSLSQSWKNANVPGIIIYVSDTRLNQCLPHTQT